MELPSRKLTWKPKKGLYKLQSLQRGAIWVSMLVWGSVGFENQGLVDFGLRVSDFKRGVWGVLVLRIIQGLRFRIEDYGSVGFTVE